MTLTPSTALSLLESRSMSESQENSELTELKHKLASTRSELTIARQRIVSLERSLTTLKHKIKRLAKKCASARHHAYHDELTGLPNRSLLLDRLKQAIVQADRQRKKVALLFIDLDKFKNINDTLGHEAGDKLLRLVADRLSSCTRYGDTACRYGGDEFVILLPNIDNKDSPSVVAEKIRMHLAVPYVIDQKILKVSASIGVTYYRGKTGEQNCHELIKQADKAMYRIKHRRNSSHQRFPEPNEARNAEKQSPMPLILQRILHLNFAKSFNKNKS